MTDKHDKLVEMALECGAVISSDYLDGRVRFERRDLAAFRDRIVASLCADVEPVALLSVCDKQMPEFFCGAAFESLPPGEHDLYPASTVAAITAQRDAALVRVAELEKDAARLDYLQRGSTVELLPPFPGFRFRIGGLHASAHTDIRSAIDAALTKGQP